ncbi:phosphodiester glycosidase family protein [Oceanobacillus sp. FSL W7-1304]|uniref:phosphodiester glycosidase family protein n=1 Tax=Oceanobacillus sp. FSL W7-1304 TaxID=2975322 RepID=UPI0030DC9FF5
MHSVKKLLALSFVFLLTFQTIGIVGYAANTESNSSGNIMIESKETPQSSKENEAQILTEIEQSERIETKSESEQIGKGVTFTTFEMLDARGWINGEMLEIDLKNEAVSLDLLTADGVVAASEPISEVTKREGAIASVNGDFFDINSTQAPLGIEIKDHEIIKGPNNGREMAAGVTTEGIGEIAAIFLEGTFTFNEQEHELASYNQNTIPENGIGLYNALWGQASREGAVHGDPNVYEVIIEEGEVVKTGSEISDDEIVKNRNILIGRGNGTDTLKEMRVGDSVTVEYAPKTNGDGEYAFAIGGNPTLVKEGAVQDVDDETLAPRTAVGFSEDGGTMYLVLVDGRQSSSRGMTLYEMAEFMKEIGSYQALNLDGGGSSTLTSRMPGENEAEVKNNPSDGVERSVPNGIGIFTAKENGQLTGLNVDTVMQHENAYRVFPELTRSFTVKGFDDAYDAVSAENIQWEAYPSESGTFNEEGVFTASKTGLAVAKAKEGNIESESRIQVLGDLKRIEATESRISTVLEEPDTFSVIGIDENGYAAPIEPEDIQLDYDESVIEVTNNEDASFTVNPKQDGASTTITVAVLDKKFYLPVTIGFQEEVVSGFEDSSDWSVQKHPSSVGASIEEVEGREGNAIQLNYDFSTTTATRAAYLQATPDLELPANTQKIGLWIHGDGNGAWLRAVLRDTSNTQYVINLADEVDWTGWKYVEASLPAGVQHPVKLWRIYPVETVQSQQYAGSLIFDELTVQVPPEVDIPEQEKITTDPLVIQNDEFGEDRWKFAVISDTQFVAANPNSDVLQRTRETLQQIVAADPEFLVINGDFVDTGYPEDFQLAKQVLEEEVGDRFPIYYVPGNHEMMGTGNLTNFEEVFGETRQSFVHNGVQFVMLNSSAGSYRASDFQQLVELQATLNKAARNPEVRNTVVFSHHPTNDPMPTDASQLSDRKEVALVEKWLSEFRMTSGGKGAIFISSHASTFNVNRVNGVPYFVTGTAGKDPYGTPDNGGILGWTMFGVENESSLLRGIQSPEETDWIRTEVNPLLEEITVDAPEELAVGETIEVKATGHQPGGINFPLRYPASVNWSGSDNVFVGNSEESNEAIRSGEYTSVFDYTTGNLRALQQGEVTLKVQSNQMESEVKIQINE